MTSEEYLASTHAGKEISELLNEVIWKVNFDPGLIERYLCKLTSITVHLFHGFHCEVIINLSKRIK